MKGLPFVLAFTAMTFVAWGAYGPLLHHGTASMGRDSLRAFVGVGIAYFFIAVIVPIFILRTQGETGKWTISGTFYSLIAGAVGALGALGVILALAYGGAPIYVMPLVFGFAPIVNTLVTAWMSKTFDQISPIFIGGIVVAALGVAGVLAFKPSAPAHAAHSKEDAKHGEAHEASPKVKDSSDNRDASRLRFVATLAQEPTAEPLPPVVVQPAAPEQPVAPEPAKEEPAKEEPTAQPAGSSQQLASGQEPTSAPQQELPPVVVQPAPPAEPSTVAPAVAPPASETPATPPAVPTETSDKPVVETPPAAAAQELPPVVVQPLPPSDSPSADTKPTDTKPAEDKPFEAKPAETKPAEANSVVPAEAAPAQPKSDLAKQPASEPTVPKQSAPEQSASEKPTPEKAASPADVAQSTPSAADAKATEQKPSDSKVRPQATWVPLDDASEPTKESAKPASAKVSAPPKADIPMIILSIVVAAVCWGSYGPMLHQGQARMNGSRLRPFTCVGLAYFIIAVAAPLAVIASRTADTGAWSVGGLTWSIIAGAAGAIGALGVILAFNAGGKPYYVMPLVFGFAPVINTCISLTENGLWGLVRPEFWISLAVVIAGAITVLINAPKPKHAKPHGAPSPAPSR